MTQKKTEGCQFQNISCPYHDTSLKDRLTLASRRKSIVYSDFELECMLATLLTF